MQHSWVDSGPGEVPPGAVIAGKTGDGRVLYIAQSHGEAGHYETMKDCAEYEKSIYAYCRNPWKILVVKCCEYILFERSSIGSAALCFPVVFSVIIELYFLKECESVFAMHV